MRAWRAACPPCGTAVSTTTGSPSSGCPASLLRPSAQTSRMDQEAADFRPGPKGFWVAACALLALVALLYGRYIRNGILSDDYLYATWAGESVGSLLRHLTVDSYPKVLRPLPHDYRGAGLPPRRRPNHGPSATTCRSGQSGDVAGPGGCGGSLDPDRLLRAGAARAFAEYLPAGRVSRRPAPATAGGGSRLRNGPLGCNLPGAERVMGSLAWREPPLPPPRRQGEEHAAC
jgi:hypothetical protein